LVVDAADGHGVGFIGDRALPDRNRAFAGDRRALPDRGAAAGRNACVATDRNRVGRIVGDGGVAAQRGAVVGADVGTVADRGVGGVLRMAALADRQAVAGARGRAVARATVAGARFQRRNTSVEAADRAIQRTQRIAHAEVVAALDDVGR